MDPKIATGKYYFPSKIFVLLSLVVLILQPVLIRAQEGRWIRSVPRINPSKQKLFQQYKSGTYQYAVSTNSVSLKQTALALAYSNRAGREKKYFKVYTWNYQFKFDAPPPVVIPGQAYQLRVYGSGNGQIFIKQRQINRNWQIAGNVPRPDARFSYKSSPSGGMVKADVRHRAYGDIAIYILKESGNPSSKTFTLKINAATSRKITISAGFPNIKVEWDYVFKRGGGIVKPPPNIRVQDCGKLNLLTRYLGELRTHQNIMTGFKRQVESLLYSSNPSPQTIINLGNNIYKAGQAYHRTLRAFQRSETRKGLFEEVNLLISTPLMFNEIVMQYRKLCGAPAKPLNRDELVRTQNEMVRKVLMLVKKKLASKLDSKGLQDILTSASWGEALNTAAYHVDRKVKEFLERETQKIFGLGFYDAASLRRALRLQMRREIFRQVGKLLVNVTSNQIIIQFLARPIIRWIERQLIPRLKEWLRPKGNLPSRVQQSISSLQQVRNQLYRLACNSRLSEVRRRLNRAEGAIHATRFLKKDLSRAGATHDLTRLSHAEKDLKRAINITTNRFLLQNQDYLDDILLVDQVVSALLQNLRSAIPAGVDVIHRQRGGQRVFRHKPPPKPVVRQFEPTVAALKFFEGGNNGVRYGNRSYATRFAASTSRFIWWELNLKHPAQGKTVNFSVVAKCYRPNGTLFNQGIKETYVKPDWTTSYHQYGVGYAQPGRWQPGWYRIDFYINGKKMTSGAFKIY